MSFVPCFFNLACAADTLLFVAVVSHIFSVKKGSSLPDGDTGISTGSKCCSVGLVVVDHFILPKTLYNRFSIMGRVRLIFCYLLSQCV